MDVLDKIDYLKEERGWSDYKLSELSGVPQSTISSWYKKRIYPTIPTLQKLCEAFNITLCDFFAEDENKIVITREQKYLLNNFAVLNKEQQKCLLAFLESFNNKV